MGREFFWLATPSGHPSVIGYKSCSGLGGKAAKERSGTRLQADLRVVSSLRLAPLRHESVMGPPLPFFVPPFFKLVQNNKWKRNFAKRSADRVKVQTSSASFQRHFVPLSLLIILHLTENF